MGATNQNTSMAHIMHCSMNRLCSWIVLKFPLGFFLFFCLFCYCFVSSLTLVACFVMFRVDLFVTSLFIVIIVDIHMLILDVCGPKHKTFCAHGIFKIVHIVVG